MVIVTSFVHYSAKGNTDVDSLQKKRILIVCLCDTKHSQSIVKLSDTRRICSAK